MKMTAKIAGMVLSIFVAGQLLAWFIASSFGFPFGSQGYGQVASITAFVCLIISVPVAAGVAANWR